MDELDVVVVVEEVVELHANIRSSTKLNGYVVEVVELEVEELVL